MLNDGGYRHEESDDERRSLIKMLTGSEQFGHGWDHYDTAADSQQPTAKPSRKTN